MIFVVVVLLNVYFLINNNLDPILEPCKCTLRKIPKTMYEIYVIPDPIGQIRLQDSLHDLKIFKQLFGYLVYFSVLRFLPSKLLLRLTYL